MRARGYAGLGCTLLAVALAAAGCAGTSDVLASAAADKSGTTAESVGTTNATTETGLGTGVATDAAAARGGRPGPRGPRLGALLGLNDEQKAQARTIHEQARSNIRALREQALADARAVLTDEQKATLDEALADLPPPPDGPPGMHAGPPPGLHGRGFGPPGGGPPPWADPNLRQAGVPAGPPPGPPPLLPPPIEDELGLSDDQAVAITAIEDALHTAVKARHEQARAEFRAILTSEQIAILDEFEAQHPRP